MIADYLPALAPIAGIIAKALGGEKPDPVEAAKAVVRAGLAFVPASDLRDYLDEEARARQDALFEEAKRRKWPSGDPDG